MVAGLASVISRPSSSRSRSQTLRVFLDKPHEKATEDFWTNSIQPSLENSQTLIILITPAVFNPPPTNFQTTLSARRRIALSSRAQDGPR